ncbi:MAG TPA: alpha/beta fold hydrolase [Casimicrobiaceae bacterium]|nr:alpha/beta fold hydrolase [Casimicrobiaceae bacterium]
MVVKAIVIVATLFMVSPLTARESADTLTCGQTEKVAFTAWTPWWFFIRPADRPPPPGAVLAPEAKMTDGVILRGIMVPALEARARRRALLVLYGNLAYSDLFYQALKQLNVFDPGYDTFIYDYRGYWRSDGSPLLRAIVDDVGELVGTLAGRYDEIRIYGTSLGALIASRTAAENKKITSIFLDGIVSRLADLSKDCPKGRLDPVDMSETTCKKVTLLIGRYDSLFRPEDAEAFIERMKSCGNLHVDERTDLGHPFSEGLNDRDRASTIRAGIIREWLASD